MARRSKTLVVFGTSLIAVACVLTYRITQRLNEKVVNLTDEQVRVMLNRELPREADKKLVEHFLEAKKWPYSEDGSTVQATIRDASHAFLIRTDIHVHFSFNSENKLISYRIENLLTGP